MTARTPWEGTQLAKDGYNRKGAFGTRLIVADLPRCLNQGRAFLNAEYPLCTLLSPASRH